MNGQILIPVGLILLVIIEGIASWREETFYFCQSLMKNIKLPFIMHGGVIIGDLFLIPTMVYLWYESLHYSTISFLLILLVSLVITWFCHRAWWFACEKQTGFMYPDRSKSWGIKKCWYKDLPVSAWLHFIYMACAIFAIGGYIFSPMPAEIVCKTCLLFIVFIPFGVIEPGIVQAWPPTKKDIVNSVVGAVALWAVVGLVTWAKLAHLQFHWKFIDIIL